MGQLEIRTGKMQYRAEDGKAPVVEGYAVVYNSLSEDMGGFREKIAPGCFTASLQSRPDIRLLIEHENLAIGRAGVNMTVTEDSQGVRFSATLDPTDPDCQRLIPKMKVGIINQMSFGFYTTKEKWSEAEGVNVREVQLGELAELSIVSMPAYPATDVALRSLEQFKATNKPAPAIPPHRDELLRARLKLMRSKR